MAEINHSMKVFFYASNPQELLDGGYDRIRIEKSIDRGTTWEALTDVDTDLIILPTKNNYWYLVDDGNIEGATSTELFRPVLHDSTLALPDVPQDDVRQAVDMSFEAVLTIEQLRAIYLFGANLTDDSGGEYPAELYAHYIRTAIDQIERDLDVKLLPVKLVERYDWWRRDYENFGFVQLREYPVISIEKYALQYPGQQQTLIEFNKEWIQADLNQGTVMVYPGNGISANAFISSGGGYLPFVLGGLDFMPNLILMEYTAGFPLGKIPPAVLECVGKKASFGPLNTAGDLIVGAGIATKSISIDGLSTSVGTTSSATNAGYGSRLIQYEKELKSQIPMLRKYFKGMKITVV